MSAALPELPHFRIPDGGEATVPPEDRGLRRDHVRLLVARPDGVRHRRFADLGDEQVFRRTNTGRLYFEPAPEITSGWVWRFGYHQIELTMPTLDLPVRVAAGRVRVSPELVLDPA